MNMKTKVGTFVLTAMTGMTLACGSVQAGQSSKDDWRNLSIGAGVLGLYGLANHNAPLALLGIGGAAYSASRYDHDRQSQDYGNWNNDHRRFHRDYDRGHGDRDDSH